MSRLLIIVFQPTSISGIWLITPAGLLPTKPQTSGKLSNGFDYWALATQMGGQSPRRWRSIATYPAVKAAGIYLEIKTPSRLEDSLGTPRLSFLIIGV